MSFILLSCSRTSTKYKGFNRNELLEKGYSFREQHMGESEFLENTDLIADELLSRNKDDYDALLLKSWTVKRKGYINGRFNYRIDDIKKSLSIINKAISLRPRDAQGWKELTTVLIDIKNLPSARKTKEKFVKFSLDHKDFQFLFDNTIFEMKISNLEKNYKKAISLRRI